LTPKDFDYSPYFEIIKHPYLGLDDVAAYRALPWNEEGAISDMTGEYRIPVDKSNSENE